MNELKNIISLFNGFTVEGYIWMSDAACPICYENDILEQALLDSVNPFPIEIMLFCKELNLSLSANYTDGEYIIMKRYLTDDEHTDDVYWPSFNKCFTVNGKMKSFANKIKMRQYWKETIDRNCENMIVLKPAEFVFIGFVN